jgi:hypothetical protein
MAFPGAEHAGKPGIKQAFIFQQEGCRDEIRAFNYRLFVHWSLCRQLRLTGQEIPFSTPNIRADGDKLSLLPVMKSGYISAGRSNQQ